MSSSLVRHQPVQDILLGKGEATRQKRIALAKQLAAYREKQVFPGTWQDTDRLGPGPTAGHTQRLASDFERRTGVSNIDRLTGGIKAHCQPPTQEDLKSAVVHRLSVANRSEAWVQDRDRKRQLLRSNLQRVEEQECSFTPRKLASEKTFQWSVTHNPEAGDIYQRSVAFLAKRDHKRAAAKSSSNSSSRQDSTVQLPPGWQTAHDATGRAYYYCAATGTTQWDPPLAAKIQHQRYQPRQKHVPTSQMFDRQMAWRSNIESRLKAQRAIAQEAEDAQLIVDKVPSRRPDQKNIYTQRQPYTPRVYQPQGPPAQIISEVSTPEWACFS